MNHPRRRIEVRRDLVDVIEVDLVFLGVSRGSEFGHLADIGERRDHLGSEEIGAQFMFGDSGAASAHACSAIVEQEMRQTVHDRVSLFWAWQRSRVEDRRPIATRLDELVHVWR